MKTKVIVVALLIAAAASADARFAWAFPRKAVSPDESGRSVVVNGDLSSRHVESELATASPSGGGRDRRKNVAR